MRFFCGHIHEPMLYNIGRDAHAVAFKPVAGTPIPLGTQRRWLAIAGIVLTTVNMFGGFAVTHRMLAMFRK